VVGGSVTFHNEDSDEHSATGGIIDSGALSPGASYTKTFAEAGTYDFLCIFHPEMQGAVEVIGETAAAPTPTASPLPTAGSSEVREGPAVGGEAVIDIVDLAFEPATAEVGAGTTVRWTNTGVAPHTATAEDGSFDSGMLDSAATFERTFSTPGTFAYARQVHPDMSGTVEVTATAAASPSSVDSVESAALEGGPAATPKPPAADDVDTVLAAADLGSMGGIALAVLMISIASALFARLLRGTVRPIDP
jgi:plastocyanin